jgi:hypothetical protein
MGCTSSSSSSIDQLPSTSTSRFLNNNNNNASHRKLYDDIKIQLNLIPLDIIDLILCYILPRWTILNGTSLIDLKECNGINFSSFSKMLSQFHSYSYPLVTSNVVMTVKNMCYIIGMNKSVERPAVTYFSFINNPNNKIRTEVIPQLILPILSQQISSANYVYVNPLVAYLQVYNNKKCKYEDRLFIFNRDFSAPIWFCCPDTEAAKDPDPEESLWELKYLPRIPTSIDDSLTGPIITHTVHKNVLYVWRRDCNLGGQFSMYIFNPNSSDGSSSSTTSRIGWEHFLPHQLKRPKDSNLKMNNIVIAVSIENENLNYSGILLIDPTIHYLIYYDDENKSLSYIKNSAKREVSSSISSGISLYYDSHECYSVPNIVKISLTKIQATKFKHFAKYDRVMNVIHYFMIFDFDDINHMRVQHWMIKLEKLSENDNNFYSLFHAKWNFVSDYHYFPSTSCVINI